MWNDGDGKVSAACCVNYFEYCAFANDNGNDNDKLAIVRAVEEWCSTVKDLLFFNFKGNPYLDIFLPFYLSLRFLIYIVNNTPTVNRVQNYSCRYIPRVDALLDWVLGSC